LNDAQGMAALLKKEGFTVRLLTNLDATRTGILGEIERIASSIKPGERFVFYFAGHGRSVPHYALMPSNCSREGNDITPEELHAAVSGIKARSRTVILDSCFSGGMAAGEMARGADGFKPRFFDPYEDRSVRFGPAPAKAPPPNVAEEPPGGDSGVCYYAAALSTEQALEGTMPDGKRHGLFTYALLSTLKPKEIWGDAHQGVKSVIGGKLQNSGRTQNPSLSAGYLGSPTFDAPKLGDPSPPPSGKTLREAWNLDNPSPKKLSIKLSPEADVVEVGRPIKMEIKVDSPGFLVVLGEVDGRLYPFYPADGASAQVKKGTIRFPADKERLFFDGFGADHVKAMLYASEGDAISVLNALKGANGQARDLVLARISDDAPLTARLSMAVGDSLVGGLRPKDLDTLYAKVVGGKDDADRAILGKLGGAATGYPRGRTWAAAPRRAAGPTRADKETFLTLLNLAISGASLYDEASMRGRVPKRLADDLKKKPKGDRLLELNRALLAALYPEEVNPDDARDR